MAEIFEFPANNRLHNRKVEQNQAQRKKLADWFRTIAAHIEGNDCEREPLAAMIVLSSVTGDEVLHTGYADHEQVNLRQAGYAAQRMATTPFVRRGGNFFDRR
ncbi:hypothetical protein [Pseudomonas fluorescens]|uniref:Uncharacterized protein n=1 Tax=Pseudomonas fluorescens TaxID=294 RepID=A0AAE2DHM7_PSEFL|nr:hypothetical protein [Pseudomonas fluorescens]KIF56186.1 hypothetical protein QS95_25205 [Pseudomonas fluorescens]